MECYPMHYTDPLYGSTLITEPVIIDLIQSPSIQRLKGIDQAGFPLPFFPSDTPISRFDHSVGVYLLLKLFQASLEEQIAGLLHDVSHTAFSHCIDYISTHESQQKQTSQDDIHERFVYASEIPQILDKYGFDTSFILNDANFPLKEQDLPDLCADRIDYSLRTAIASHVCSQSEAFSLVQAFIPSHSKWVFRSSTEALQYAEVFSALNTHRYSALPSALMFHTVGSALRYALDAHYISHSDLFSTDKIVLDIILFYTQQDPHLKKLIDRMYNKTQPVQDPVHYETKVFCKSRVVDPFCLHQGSMQRLSDIHHPWKDRVTLESSPRSYCFSWRE